MTGYGVKSIAVREVGDCDVFIFDAVDAAEVEVKGDVSFDTVDSGFLFLVDDLLG